MISSTFSLCRVVVFALSSPSRESDYHALEQSHVTAWSDLHQSGIYIGGNSPNDEYAGAR